MPGLKDFYEEQCRAHGHEPGIIQFPVPGSPTAVFVADDVDAAWEVLGPHLLHDAVTAASYLPEGDAAASITRADSVAALRAEGGPYRILPLWRRRNTCAAGACCHCIRYVAACHPKSRGHTSNVPQPPPRRPTRNEGSTHDPHRRVIHRGSGSDRHRGHQPSTGPETRWRLAHSPDKVGKDAGELAGVAPIGVAATNDAAALIDLAPDCVVYAASGPERDGAAVPYYLRLLAAGINVVSTSSTSLVYPPSYFAPQWRDQLDGAATAVGASLYVSGIFPGFASDQLALLMT
ncbi:MAG: hypothetical protein QOC58_82, partial [Mycobacterium sp.]|nr:hypothetical protein [Mycobacterium sp.]